MMWKVAVADAGQVVEVRPNLFSRLLKADASCFPVWSFSSACVGGAHDVVPTVSFLEPKECFDVGLFSPDEAVDESEPSPHKRKVGELNMFLVSFPLTSLFTLAADFKLPRASHLGHEGFLLASS